MCHAEDGPGRRFTRVGVHPMNKVMDANGVAREFWSEVFDVRTPVEDLREKRVTKVRRKKVRTVAPPRRSLRPSG